MSNLIRNELYKVFHKKAIYIFLFIVTAFLVLMGFLGKKEIDSFDKFNIDSQITEAEIEVSNYKTNISALTDEEKELYIEALANLDTLELAKSKNYNTLSAEFNYIRNNIYSFYLVKNYVNEKYYDYTDLGYESVEDYNNKFNEALKKLDSFVPIEEVKNDLNNLNKETVCSGINKNSCDEYFNVYKKTLEYRIKHNIPYNSETGSNTLNQYLESYPNYIKLRDKYEKSDKDKKEEYETLKMNIKLTEYKMEHDMLEDTESEFVNSAEYIASPLSELSIFIIFGVVVIACGIFSDEFDKGTIKQLLIKPFSRNKIALAKVITCLISTLLFIVYFEIVNIICGLLLIKSFDIGGLALVYDYILGKVLALNGFELLGLHFLYNIPYFIIFTLIILLVSVLTRNTALSAVASFMLIVVPPFLEMLINKFEFLVYLPFYTWNLSEFMFGGKSAFKQLTFTNSLIADIIYIILFIVGILITFKHIDVKNQ